MNVPNFYDRMKFPEKITPVSKKEAEFIYKFIKEKEIKDTLEIGLGYGGSAAYIISASRGKHYIVDPFQKHYGNTGLKNLKSLGLSKNMIFLDNFSHSALPQLLDNQVSIDFAFIDGDHGYDTAFIDFYYVDLLLRKGGYVLFHDIRMKSIREVASWIKQNKLNYKQVKLPSALWNFIMFRKIKKDSILRWYNRGCYNLDSFEGKSARKFISYKNLFLSLGNLMFLPLFNFMKNLPSALLGIAGKVIKKINPKLYQNLKRKIK